MPVLQVKTAPASPEQLIAALPDTPLIEDELDTMIRTVINLDPSQPDVIISTCMALMARCTEIYVRLIRLEDEHRRARYVRTQQLQKVMDLLDYTFKGASRLVEVARQELDTTR